MTTAAASARAILMCVGIAALASPSPAVAQVYKCTQTGGRVLYSDTPCKGGAVVDVSAGSANPIAVRQLERDNAAFDRKMAMLHAAQEQAEFRREQLNAQLEAARAVQGTASPFEPGPYEYAPGNAFVATPRIKRQTHSHTAHALDRRVPASAPPSGGLRRRSR